MATFRVIATRSRTDENGWRCSEQIPTFLLDVYSIEGARELAIATVVPHDRRASTEVHGGIVNLETLDYLGF